MCSTGTQRPYFGTNTVPDPDAAPEEWNVDKILDFRERDGKQEFLTKWSGHGREEANWEPIDNFFQRYCSEPIKYAKERGGGAVNHGFWIVNRDSLRG